MSREFVVLAKIEYVTEAGFLRTLGVSSRPYTVAEAGLYRNTWYPILFEDISYDLVASLPWEDGSVSVSVGDIRLFNGGDGLDQHILDEMMSAFILGQQVEVKRGYTDETWAEMEQVFLSRTDDFRFDGEELILAQRPYLDDLEGPINTQVFGDDTPNPRIINKTVPILLGEVFQLEPIIYDAPNQVYYVGSNVSNIKVVREGGFFTDNYVELDFGFQMLQNSNLQLTCDAIGPPPTGTVTESILVNWLFDVWTGDDPDGIDVTETVTSAEITQNGTQADIFVNATPTADTGFMSLTSPFEPLFAGLPGNGSWTAVGAASVEEAVVVDDGSYAEATVFDVTTLRVASYLPNLPAGNQVTGVEIELIAEGTNVELAVLTANQTNPGTRIASYVDVENSGITASSVTSTKTTIVGGGPNFYGAGVGVREDVDSDDVNPGMHFTLQFRPATAGSATMKVYQVRVKVHHAPTIDIVRLFTQVPVLTPGVRHRIEIEASAADCYARWGGSPTSGGALKDSSDPFSTSLSRLRGPTTFTFEFKPETGEDFFGIEFKRLNSAGTATINNIKVLTANDGINSYPALVEYMVELKGLDPATVIDQSFLTAHDADVGNPPMGWYITSNESVAEMMTLFAKSLSGIWWQDRDGKLRSRLWNLDQGATPVLSLDTIVQDGREFNVRLQRGGTVRAAAAPRATERAVGARNWRPLRINETAGISTEFTEQDRANVVEDWRVIRRVDFDNLNPWPVA